MPGETVEPPLLSACGRCGALRTEYSQHRDGYRCWWCEERAGGPVKSIPPLATFR